MSGGEMGQKPSLGDEALKHLMKKIGPLQPRGASEFKKRVDEVFDKEALNAILRTSVTDLFEPRNQGEARNRTKLIHARLALLNFFDPRTHPMIGVSSDSSLTVGDVLNFRVVQDVHHRLYSEHKQTGTVMRLLGIGGVTLQTIQERLGTLGLELECIQIRNFGDDSDD